MQNADTQFLICYIHFSYGILLVFYLLFILLQCDIKHSSLAAIVSKKFYFHTVFQKKRGVELFAISSSTVN